MLLFLPKENIYKIAKTKDHSTKEKKVLAVKWTFGSMAIVSLHFFWGEKSIVINFSKIMKD